VPWLVRTKVFGALDGRFAAPVTSTSVALGPLGLDRRESLVLTRLSHLGASLPEVMLLKEGALWLVTLFEFEVDKLGAFELLEGFQPISVRDRRIHCSV